MSGQHLGWVDVMDFIYDIEAHIIFKMLYLLLSIFENNQRYIRFSVPLKRNISQFRESFSTSLSWINEINFIYVYIDT